MEKGASLGEEDVLATSGRTGEKSDCFSILQSLTQIEAQDALRQP